MGPTINEKLAKAVDEDNEKETIESFLGRRFRARSLVVGVGFGVVEVGMRLNNGDYVWTALGYDEAVDCMHLLAAVTQQEITLTPRKKLTYGSINN